LVQVCYYFLILCFVCISVHISNFLPNVVGGPGDKGQKGQQGEQGLKGFQGEQGPVVSR
jgi:hypothetical protein